MTEGQDWMDRKTRGTFIFGFTTSVDTRKNPIKQINNKVGWTYEYMRYGKYGEGNTTLGAWMDRKIRENLYLWVEDIRGYKEKFY